MADCPECGKALVEEADSCAECGWPHAEREAASGAPDAVRATAPTGTSGMTYLLVGVVIGFLAGYFIGTMTGTAPAPAAPQPGAAVVVPPAVSPQENPAPPRPDALRLRELGWKQSTPEQCMGHFQVVSAPATVRVLEFSVTDSEGKVIGSDKVTATKPIKAGTMLELGFSVPSCAAIQRWRVQIVER